MAKPQTLHSEYAEYRAQWAKCRAAISGEDAIHDAGDTYLPRLKGQSDADYKSYVLRAPFYNATSRTLDGLVGMIFRKDPSVTVPTALEGMVADMTMTDCDLNEFAEGIAREVLGVGRIGVLVEYPAIIDRPANQAQAAAQNLRPYATNYKAENIINWKVARVNNAMQPVMIALSEIVTEYVSEFESEAVNQIRALLLIDGVYIQRLYREQSKDKWAQFGDDIIPMMRGKSLSYIPFVFFNANGNADGVCKPPLLDLINMNLSHYRATADYEHGCHYTGLPTAVVSGYQPRTNDQGVVTETLAIGSSTAWIFPQSDAKAFYLEFTGQGLGTLENNIKAKTEAMSALGARMLAPEKSGVEATNTVRMRHSGEGAVLSSMVNMINAGLLRVLSIMAEWENVVGEITVALNKDFIDASMSAQEVLAMVQAWQAGALPKEELFHNLKNGEVIRAETTYDDYLSMGESEPPMVA